MAATITIAPIVDGKLEEWNEFLAELQGPRRIEWAQSQRRRGITRQVVGLAEGDPSLAVVYTEVRDAGRAQELLSESDDEFDVWFRSRIAELHGQPYETDVVFDSAPKPGPWRGWR